MNLDTDRFRSDIQGELKRIEQQQENLRKEIARLDTEKDRLSETFEAVDAVERMARELEVLRKLDKSSDEPQKAAEAPKAAGGSQVQDFKQWA